MEWTFYAPQQPHNSQGLFNVADTMTGMSPDGSDDEFGLGSAALDLELADLGSTLSDMLAWDASGLVTTAKTSLPESAAVAARAGSMHSSSANQSPPVGSPHSSSTSSTWRCTPASPCIAAVTGTISALHTCTDMCLSSSSLSSSSSSSSSSALSALSAPSVTAAPHPQGRTADAVLTAGRDAALAISAALSCVNCSGQPQLHLLLTAALEKLVGWYRAVVASMRETTTATETTVAGDADHLPVVLLLQPPLTIAIGSYPVEESLKMVIMAPVVMHRLRELKGLVDLLARRMGGTLPAGHSNHKDGGSLGLGQDTQLPEMIRDKLIARVRQQLLAAGKELATLREGQCSGSGDSLWLY